MLALEFRFPAGRYHATPWGHHVNEGLVEWPPSPWRIARALLATWHRKASHLIDEDVVRRVIAQLCTELPRYRLPPTAAAHTRHYMPLWKGSTTKVFDAFLHVQGHADEALVVAWPSVELADDERSALGELLDRMGYLGRAESWVEARLCPQSPALADLPVVPHDGSSDRPGHDVIRSLAPRLADDYQDWRTLWLEARRDEVLAGKRVALAKRNKSPTSATLGRKDLEKIEASAPPDLWSALDAETTMLRKQGWSQPPGSRWVQYLRPRDIQPPAPARTRSTARPTVARFAVTSKVRPRLTDALQCGEGIRARLLQLVREDPPEVFLGHRADGSPSLGHGHSHVVAESNDRRGLVTHVSIYAPMGFDERARRGLDRLTRAWAAGRELDLTLLGVGDPADFAGHHGERGECPLFATSAIWESRTPFVPTRHGKRRKNGQVRMGEDGLQIDGPQADLQRLLRLRGVPPFEVEPLPAGELGGRPTRWLEYATFRRTDHGDRPRVGPWGFRITFTKPVSGPLLFGYGAHFGLGAFVPSAAPFGR